MKYQDDKNKNKKPVTGNRPAEVNKSIESHDINNPDLRQGDIVSGYKIIKIEKLNDIDSVFYQLEHIATGARHIHISNKDRENTFGVAFRTVPSDSTGVAHVLEHTALCGSRKFNVRDPFFSMLKRGLSTFMNAFTASDWTMYPFSTQNRKDFYNLMDVYLDAAFFPKLDELSFKQEGHRMELVMPENGMDDEDGENAEPKLIYKGVVYNEMKGAMSSPSQIMGRSLLKYLYPSTTYSFNSGGEPSEIPKLTHKALLEFHARFYHPSNSFFYTYGCFPLKDHLDFISENVLDEFVKTNPDSEVKSQPRWSRPRKATEYYPLAKDENPEKKYQACVAWLTADIRDSFEILVLTVLEQILIGNSASPLRKALIDSNLGSALSDATGFDPDMKDTMFACGLKDISLDSVEKIEKIIFTSLEKLAREGIDKTLIDSAIHQIEFSRKEITNTPHPFGIKLLLSFAGAWIQEGDPLSYLNFTKDLRKLNAEIEKGEFFERKIRQYFLDNMHRLVFTLAPDQEMEERENKRLKEELAEILRNMDDKQLDSIKRDMQLLKELQETKEDLSSLPCLELSDVPAGVEIIKPDVIDKVSYATCYDKATSGILYFSCPVIMNALSQDILYLIPFFCHVFTGVGTSKRDYAEMARLIDLYTGGISMSPFAGTDFSDKEKCLLFLAFQGKALDRNINKLFELIDEFLLEYNFSDLTRLKSLLFQYRAGMESSIVSNGHRYAMSLASRNFSESSFASEIWHGIYQYKFIRELTEKFTGSKENDEHILASIASDLRKIAEILLKRENLKPALVGGKQSIILADTELGSTIQELACSFDDCKSDSCEIVCDKTGIEVEAKLPFEGWSTSTSVSFVAQAFKTVRLGHKDAPALAVIGKMLRSLYLHREIREKGGAYGGFAMYNSGEGIFAFGSYRDPYIRRTLDVYEDACAFIKKGDYTQDDIKEAVLQVCAEIDRPETPGPASIKAFYRDILQLSDEKREKFKKDLLCIDKKAIIEVAEKYFNVKANEKGTAVISGREQLEQANMGLKSGQNPLELFKI